jgi:hypothetical protein
MLSKIGAKKRSLANVLPISAFNMPHFIAPFYLVSPIFNL